MKVPFLHLDKNQFSYPMSISQCLVIAYIVVPLASYINSIPVYHNLDTMVPLHHLIICIVFLMHVVIATDATNQKLNLLERYFGLAMMKGRRQQVRTTKLCLEYHIQLICYIYYKIQYDFIAATTTVIAIRSVSTTAPAHAYRLVKHTVRSKCHRSVSA